MSDLHDEAMAEHYARVAAGEFGGLPERECPDCDGDGWYIDHAVECWATGSCNCTGVQIQCGRCGGSGAASS